MKPCKDCASTTRPRPHPGPRCATCHRARRKVVSAANHARAIVTRFGITPAEYEQLLAAQGGKCAICRRGSARRFPVDHDHRTGLVRGLLCSFCNYDVLGKLGDDPDTYRRIVAYLNQPPAVVIIGRRRVPTLEASWPKPTS